MNKDKKTKEKICAFYASDYHFEMLSLPYINKNLIDNKEIIILTENDLEGTINTLLKKTNLEENKKENIMKLDWNVNDFEKTKKIEQNTKDEKDTIIFIKGKENYIKNINKNIENCVRNSEKIKIVDCYDMNEIASNLDEIMQSYSKVLSTSGEKNIN